MGGDREVAPVSRPWALRGATPQQVDRTLPRRVDRGLVRPDPGGGQCDDDVRIDGGTGADHSRVFRSGHRRHLRALHVTARREHGGEHPAVRAGRDPGEEVGEPSAQADQHPRSTTAYPVEDALGGDGGGDPQQAGDRRQAALDLGSIGALADARVDGDPGRDAARVDAGDADAPEQLGPQRLGQTSHGELAGDVRGLLGRGDETEDAGEVDQMGSRVLQQDGDQRMRQGEDGVEVDLHQPVELLQGEVGEGPGQGHPGVVDHQGELRVLARQPSAQGDRGLVITEVGDDGVDPEGRVLSLDRRGHRRQPVLGPVQQHQMAAAGRQAVGQRLADTARRAGDQCGSVSELVVDHDHSVSGRRAADRRSGRWSADHGRVSENFKLLTGTWVSVGTLRLALISACAPLVQDAVITGHDRNEIGALLFLNAQACRTYLGGSASLDMTQLAQEPRICRAIADGMNSLAASAGGSSQAVRRALILLAPPSLDIGEITDKGYINQRAVLENRADQVARLYEEPINSSVISLGD